MKLLVGDLCAPLSGKLWSPCASLLDPKTSPRGSGACLRLPPLWRSVTSELCFACPCLCDRSVLGAKTNFILHACSLPPSPHGTLGNPWIGFKLSSPLIFQHLRYIQGPLVAPCIRFSLPVTHILCPYVILETLVPHPSAQGVTEHVVDGLSVFSEEGRPGTFCCKH